MPVEAAPPEEPPLAALDASLTLAAESPPAKIGDFSVTRDMFDIVEYDEDGVTKKKIFFWGGGTDAFSHETRKYTGTGRPPNIPVTYGVLDYRVPR